MSVFITEHHQTVFLFGNIEYSRRKSSLIGLHEINWLRHIVKKNWINIIFSLWYKLRIDHICC